jgi:hypothetical protein
LQFPTPSQIAAPRASFPEQEGGPHVVPAGSGVHSPLPLRLQALQGPQEGELQQTPSTQNPPQAALLVHGFPGTCLGEQLPPLQ